MSSSFTVYILYSKTLDRFYIGATGDRLGERIRKHNTNHSGFTGKTNDWTLCHTEHFDSMTQALAREKEIKKRKSRKYIESLLANA